MMAHADTLRASSRDTPFIQSHRVELARAVVAEIASLLMWREVLAEYLDTALRTRCTEASTATTTAPICLMSRRIRSRWKWLTNN